MKIDKSVLKYTIGTTDWRYEIKNMVDKKMNMVNKQVRKAVWKKKRWK